MLVHRSACPVLPPASPASHRRPRAPPATTILAGISRVVGTAVFAVLVTWIPLSTDFALSAHTPASPARGHSPPTASFVLLTGSRAEHLVSVLLELTTTE
jgi:hypothetical protein